MTLHERLEPRAQRKLLAIDGGGIRGILALEILRKVEVELREKTRNPDLRLGDWFDFIGGTSTGAIVAAGLARGMTDAGDHRFLRAERARHVRARPG